MRTVFGVLGTVILAGLAGLPAISAATSPYLPVRGRSPARSLATHTIATATAPPCATALSPDDGVLSETPLYVWSVLVLHTTCEHTAGVVVVRRSA